MDYAVSFGKLADGVESYVKKAAALYEVASDEVVWEDDPTKYFTES